jgi:hypothetical protein
MSAVDLEGRYRRMLRWYPPTWRSRNERAVVGVLLDQAEDQARTAPAAGERLSLMAGGLHERFLRAERPSALHIVVPLAAVAFSAWYLAVIGWAPGITYPGVIAPFSNPVPLTAVLLAAALLLVALRRIQLARLFSAAAALCAIAVFFAGATLGWLGPSAASTVLFVGLGAVSALRRGGVRQAILLLGAIGCAGLSAEAITACYLTLPVIGTTQFVAWAAVAFGAAVSAVLLTSFAARLSPATPATTDSLPR